MAGFGIAWFQGLRRCTVYSLGSLGFRKVGIRFVWLLSSSLSLSLWFTVPVSLGGYSGLLWNAWAVQ